MSRFLKTVFIAMFLISGNISAAYLFKHIDINNGLSQNTVSSILQDRNGFIWFATKNGLNRYDGTHFRIYYRKPSHGALGSDYINTLCETPDGDIYIGTDEGVFVYSSVTDNFRALTTKANDGVSVQNNVTALTLIDNELFIAANEQGLFRYNPRTRAMRHYPLRHLPNVASVARDARGCLYIGLYGGGLMYSMDNLATLHPLNNRHGKQMFKDEVVSRVVPTPNGTLYVGSSVSGLSIVNTATHAVIPLLKPYGAIFVRDLLVRGREIWAASERGLFVYNLDTKRLEHYRYEPSNPLSLSDNPLYALCMDREGSVWIGSYFGGVNYYPNLETHFEKFIPNSAGMGGLHGRRVREFEQDQNGRIWIGTEDGGLNCMDPQTGQIEFVKESEAFNNVHALLADGNTLWVGTFTNGLKQININTRRMLRSFNATERPGDLHDNSIFALYKTRSGQLYVGTVRGLYLYDQASGKFSLDKRLPPVLIYDIHEDRRGALWVATYSDGVFRRGPKTRLWTQYKRHHNARGLTSDKVLSVFEDSKGRIYLTTQGGGVCLYHAATNSFTTVPIPQREPRSVVFRIVESADGVLWLTTNKGLVRYNTSTRNSRTFTTNNGLLDDQFNYSSSLLAADGRIFFGSLNGFIAFHPLKFTDSSKERANIVISELMVNNQPMNVVTTTDGQQKSIITASSLRLDHDQNSIAFRMATLNYAVPQVKDLEYRLKGYEDKWQNISDNAIIAFSKLPFGHYTLEVRKAGGQNGAPNDRPFSMNIEIEPPFYLSPPAIIFYIIFASTVMWLIIRAYHAHHEAKRKLSIESFEREKEKELYQFKIKFFTNVAHEIRTPLSLIKAPLENILNGRSVKDQRVLDDLNVMELNTQRLLNLTNQLLDFRRAEQDTMRMNFVRCDICQIINDTLKRFRPAMRQRSLTLSVHLPNEGLTAHVDKEGFTKILSNLLNNALRYGSAHVWLTLDAHPDSFTLLISNDGPVIPQNMRQRIFEPFVRIGNNEQASGTGIGLPMSKSLAELHHGQLLMDNNEKLNTFMLTLPTRQNGAIEIVEEQEYTSQEPEAVTPLTKHRHTLLVVDDNAHMLAYLETQLGRQFNIVTATNGKEAIERLEQDNIDLVISDVMMEPMDGITLCQNVKNDIRHSHLPFILLTAITSDSAKVQGMDSGANAYIEKPFSLDYLVSTAKNLLRNRENALKAYAKSPFVSTGSVATNKVDEKFIDQLTEAVAANLTNSDFNVDTLANNMNMSRTNLNRKIRSTLDISPNDYIRLERLKKAAELLRSGEYKINEVCYMVGFSTPSYFAKCFVKQFGMLPKDFMAK